MHGPGNSTITGPGYEYIVSPGATYTLAYPAASGDQSTAVLTHRIHLDDVAQVVPSSGWAYTDATNTAIKLIPGPFVANDIYEFSYTPRVRPRTYWDSRRSATQTIRRSLGT